MENNENNVQKEINQGGQAKKGGNKAPKMTVVLVTAIIILVVGIGIGGGFLLANKDKKDSGNSNTATNTNTTNDTTNQATSVSFFEANKNIQYTSNPEDDINGKVAIIKLGEKVFKTEEHEGYYTYKDGFGISPTFDIKKITDISSEYCQTSVDNKIVEFKCKISYVDKNNQSGSFDVAVLMNKDFTNPGVEGVFDSFSGSTRSVKLFGDYAFLYKGKQYKSISQGCTVVNEYEVTYSKKNESVDDIVIYTDVQGCALKSTIHINDITIISEESASGIAGNLHYAFKFVGDKEITDIANNDKSSGRVTGTGVFEVSTNGAKSTYKIKLNINEPVTKATYNASEFEVSASGEVILEESNT